MKKILITQRLMETPEYKETRECLDIQWSDFLNKCGIIPIPLPIKSDMKTFLKKFQVDGILLSGGEDLFCCSPQSLLSKQRDEFEKGLLKEGIRRHIPILGVCRGMQMIAHYFGIKIEPIDSHAGTKHYIEIAEEGCLYNFYRKKHKVNSYHKYGILHTIKPLTRLAVSIQDKSIESIYHKEFNIAGIMWHPERERPYSLSDMSFFRHFFGGEQTKCRGKI